MEVALTPEQLTFQKVCAALALELRSEWDVGRDPASVAMPVPTAAQWSRITEAGWTALRLEDDGETLGTVLDAAVLVEQLGKYAVPAPVLGTLLVAEQLRLAGADSEWQDAVATGTERLSPCFTSDLRGFAARHEPGPVVDAGGATTAVVISSDNVEHRQIVEPRTGADLTRVVADAGSVVATHRVQPHPQMGKLQEIFALTLFSADLLGAMEGAFEAAVDHIGNRHQFGVPIGSFQAVQHLAAECLVSIEATRSAVWYAAWAADYEDVDNALEAARITKAFASEHAVEVVEAALQMFGGIAMTWESPIHVWQRRVHLDRRLLGDEHHHYGLLAARSI